MMMSGKNPMQGLKAPEFLYLALDTFSHYPVSVEGWILN